MGTPRVAVLVSDEKCVEGDTSKTSKEKSSHSSTCDQLTAAKELLNTHDISLGAVNMGSATDSGQKALVRFVFHARRDTTDSLFF